MNKRAIKMRKPGDDAEITPDAILIAAAPKMLSALKIAKEEFERRDGVGTCPTEIEDLLGEILGQNAQLWHGSRERTPTTHKTMEPPPESNTQRAAVAHQRLVRRLEQRDRKIAGLERKIKRLEEALTWRTIDLESLSRNVRREVQDALCNVRMIPVFGGTRDQVITEVRNTPANAKDDESPPREKP